MGQRHQIYIQLPAKFYFEGNPNNKPARVIGLHHQWLYGHSALSSLQRLLTFISKQGDYGPIGRGQGEEIEVIKAIYACDWTSGYFHGVHDISDETSCIDPREGDNNDGITIVDLSGKAPKYCFMSVHHLEGRHGDKTPVLKPLSAKQYLAAYYSKSDIEEFDQEDQSKVEELLSFFNFEKVLTTAQVRKIFPAMYQAHIVEQEA